VSSPALGILELTSIARGVVCADAMAKRAPIRILQTHPISPGKHVVVIAGDVAEVEEAIGAGVAAAGAALVDRLMLPQAHVQLAPLVAAGAPVASPARLDAVAVFETFTVCSTVLAADAAAKAAEVRLLEMRLGQGLGGKAFFTMTGALDAVEAAAAAGRAAIEAGLLVGIEVIPAPHEDLRSRLLW
jgi:microcompartment protein CcmL/EutN